MSGIGNTTELGYVNAVHESIKVGGKFDLGGEVRWTSFRATFKGNDVESQGQDQITNPIFY